MLILRLPAASLPASRWPGGVIFVSIGRAFNRRISRSMPAPINSRRKVPMASRVTSLILRSTRRNWRPMASMVRSSAQLRLAGTVQAPTLNASAEASRLYLPGVAQLSGLKLSLNAGGAANAPLTLDLAVARIDDAGQVMLARAIQLKASGSNAHHSIQGGAELAGERKLALRLQGGLEEMRWRGELQEASLSGGIEGFKLTAPTALAVAAEAWSFGPAQLAGLDPARPWQARLQANADARQLRAELSARGPRLGEIDGKMEAAMSGAWSLNQQAPWLATLTNRSDDLGWLAGLLGEGWKTGGRLSGELKIAGTPAQPISSGRYRGEELMLQISGQGLHLANGKLDVELSNNLLHVNQLNFDSLLQKPPRALLRSERVDLAALTGRPGRLEIGGEMRVDRNKLGDRAALDVRLERFGVYQRPDEWVLLSGNGRLNWENRHAGHTRQAGRRCRLLATGRLLERPGCPMMW